MTEKQKKQAEKEALDPDANYTEDKDVYKRQVENPDLKILRFPEMSDEWLDFIAKCRAGETHPYDIVEGPMACLLYTSGADDELSHHPEPSDGNVL